jgi:hypothetical protein
LASAAVARSRRGAAALWNVGCTRLAAQLTRACAPHGVAVLLLRLFLP